LPYFTSLAFYIFLKIKSELASCLLTQGTHYRYRRARRHRPVVDGVLQKKHKLLMTMAKNYLKKLSL
jgi:hypothetical protein